RMRPRSLARQWGLDPRTAIETFLAAAREGLLALRWDLLCPRCRGAKFVAASLDRLPQGAHCPSCNIEYERDFARNVEVTFEPDAEIRALGVGTYCIASPLASDHVKVQQTLAPGEAVEIAVELADGDYRAHTLEPGGSADFSVSDGVIPRIALGADGPMLSPGARPGGGGPRLGERRADRARGDDPAGVSRPVRRRRAAAGRPGRDPPAGADVHRHPRVERPLQPGRRRARLRLGARALCGVDAGGPRP